MPRLNKTLLFNCDDHTRLQLLTEINKYQSDHLSIKGSCWTRNDFVTLSRFITEPEYRSTQAIMRPNHKHFELLWSPQSGIIKHLKKVSKFSDVEYPTLRLVYEA